MTKNPNTQWISTQKPEPSFKINPTNTLKHIKSIEQSKYPDITTVSEQVRILIIWRMKRLFGNRYMTSSIPTILQMSRLVLEDDFRWKAGAILEKHAVHLAWLHNENTWERSGALERVMLSTDSNALRYIHHIIPQERWWGHADENLFQLDEGDHFVFHEMFSTLTPVEQIAHIVLLLRRKYDPALVNSICQLILSQNQNLHHKKEFLRYGQIEYPPGVWSFMKNLNWKQEILPDKINSQKISWVD